VDTEEKLRIIRLWCKFTQEQTRVGDVYARIKFNRNLYNYGLFSFITNPFNSSEVLVDYTFRLLSERIWNFIIPTI